MSLFKTANSASRSPVFKLFTIPLLFFFVIILLINAIAVSVQQRDVGAGLKDVAGRLLLTTDKLNKESLEIINKTELEGKAITIFDKIWFWIKHIVNLLLSLYIIYNWLKVFAIGYIRIVIGNTSETTAGWFCAIITYSILEIMALVVSGGWKNANVIWKSWYNFGRAVASIFSPLKKVAEHVTETGNNTSNG